MCIPKISVIIPVYNTEKYVERCVRSVLNQTYSNIEVICVDDGSTDQSGMILDEIAKEDERMKVVHHSKSGVGISRNLGMEIATGDYYGFVDSDDYISKDMYAVLVSGLNQYDVDIVTCSYYFDYSGEIKEAKNQKEVPTIPIETLRFLKYVWERDVYNGVANYLWTKLIKKEIVKNEKGKLIEKFDSGFSGTDISFLSKIILKAKQILYVEQPLYYYYQREDSIVHNNKKQLDTLNWIQSYEKIIGLYQEKRVPEEITELVKRMYVYRCGKVLEVAIEQKDKEKVEILKSKIKEVLSIYVKTNRNYPERVEWIHKLLE